MDWNKFYEKLTSLAIALTSAIAALPIGDIFIAFLGGAFQIGVTVGGAIGSFYAIEALKSRHEKNKKK